MDKVAPKPDTSCESFHIADVFALGDLSTDRSRVRALNGGIRLIALGTNRERRYR